MRLLNHRLSARFLSNAGELGISQAALVLVLGLDGGGFTQGLLGVPTWCSCLDLFPNSYVRFYGSSILCGDGLAGVA